MRKARKALVILLMVSGALCIIGALALAGYNIWDENRAGESVETDYAVLAEVIPEKDEEEQPIVPEEQPMMTYMEVDGRKYVGYLEIPAIDKYLPVQADCAESLLKHSPCLYDGTIYDGMIIAGHNYRSHFSPLKQLDLGADIYFHDVDGNVWQYTLTATEVIDGYDVDAMKAGDWDLTLFTCTYGGEERYTLRCSMEITVQ